MDDQTPPEAVATVDLEIPAEIEDVWSALTTDEGLADWMGANATIERQANGMVHFPDPVTGRPRSGIVEHIETDREIAFTWWPEDDPSDVTDVFITLEPAGDNTLIRVVETPAALTSTVASSIAPVSSLPALVIADWTWRLALLSVCHVAIYV